MKVLVVGVSLALMVVLAAASTDKEEKADKSNSLLTEIIRMLAEDNRGRLANLTIPSISLVDKGELTNLSISNAELFVIEALDAPGPLSLTISDAIVTLDEIGLSGEYFFIDVPVPDLWVVLTGLGAISGTAYGARVQLTNADFHLEGLSGITLLDFDTLTLNVDSLKFRLEGVDQVTCDAVAEYLPKFLERYLPRIILDAKGIIIYTINKILSGL